MGDHSGMPPMGDHSGMPPMDDHSGMPPMGDHSGMPPMGDHSGMPPMDDHSGMPPTGMSNLGAHCGNIQAKNEKKRMRKEVKCLRRALHEHKPTVKLRQTKDGLGAYGCGVRKTGSKTAQIACLRGLLDGPGGTPGMPPTMGAPHMPPTGAPGMPPTMGKPGKKGKMGNYGCGQKKRQRHVNCLRRLLDTTSHAATVRKGKKGMGLYGCGQKNRRKHVNCLRRLLDQHGPHLVGQGIK